MLENTQVQYKTVGLTAKAIELLLRELSSRRKLGYAVSKTSLASEAIIAVYGGGKGGQNG